MEFNPNDTTPFDPFGEIPVSGDDDDEILQSDEQANAGSPNVELFKNAAAVVIVVKPKPVRPAYDGEFDYNDHTPI